MQIPTDGPKAIFLFLGLVLALSWAGTPSAEAAERVASRGRFAMATVGQ